MKTVRTFAAWFLALTVGATALSLSGCNTAEGMGEDVEAAGEEVQDVAN